MQASPPQEDTLTGWVPDLLKPYPRLAQLYRAVVDNPLEDEPRLQFADACREQSDDDRTTPEAVPAWADFIALQFRLHRMGKPRHRIRCDSFRHHGGPDYYRAVVPDVCPARVGDRVDVSVHPGMAAASGTRTGYKGLLVRRVEPHDVLHVDLVLKRDEESKPFPDKEFEELHQKCRGLLDAHGLDWCGYAGNGSILSRVYPADVGPNGAWSRFLFECRRGFVSRVRLDWSYRTHTDLHSTPQPFPISDIDFLDAPYCRRIVYNDRVEFWIDDLPGATLRLPKLPDWYVGDANPETQARVAEMLLSVKWPGRRVRVRRDPTDLML